jgi:urease accessory protein
MVGVTLGALTTASLIPRSKGLNGPAVMGRDVGRDCLSYASEQGGLERFDAQGAIDFVGEDATLSTLRQQAPIRFLRPYPEIGDPSTTVLVNTAGGVVGGDRLAVDLGARDGAKILVTGQAAEKIYRSDGGVADLSVTLEARSGAALEFLPQGTILFDGARLRRWTTLRVDADATMLFGEILHFGRSGMGESFTNGEIHDRLDVERDGERVWVDAFRVTEDTIGAMRSRSGLAGAIHTAVLVLMTSTPGDYVNALREVVDGARDAGVQAGVQVGVSAFKQGPLVARWLGDDSMALRRSFAAAWCYLRAHALDRPARMPKIWSI